MKELIENLIHDYKEDELILMEGIYEGRLHTFAVLQDKITWVRGPCSLEHLNTSESYSFKERNKYACTLGIVWLSTTHLDVAVYKRNVYLKDYVPALEKMQGIKATEETDFYSSITKTDLIILACELKPSSAMHYGKQINFRETITSILDGTARDIEFLGSPTILTEQELKVYPLIKITKHGNGYTILRINKYSIYSKNLDGVGTVKVYANALAEQRYFNTTKIEELKLFKAIKSILGAE